jgi:predicted TIM-barrel fold metal-dependent hydrolase
MLQSIDVHAHVLPSSYRRVLEALGISTEREDGFPEPHWDEDAHLAFMEETGQAFELLSISSPHPHCGNDDLALAHAWVINDEMAAICARHHDKLGFCTYLPLPNVEGSLSEAVRGFDELGALGVKLPSNARGMYLGNRALDPLYCELDRRGAIAIIHPTAPQQTPDGLFTTQVKPLFEFISDTTRSVIDLLVSGALDRWPNIRWVVPHCGSFLPEIAHRLAGIQQVLVPRGMMEAVDVLGGLRRLYYDVAGDARPVMLDALLKIADPTHVLYGSDYPYTPSAIVGRKKQELADDPLLADIKDEVFFANAAQLLGLDERL